MMCSTLALRRTAVSSSMLDCRKPPSPETDTTLRLGLTSHAPMAHGSATPMVCWPLEIITARPEAVEIAGDPDVEAAHVDGQGHVVIHDVLHGPHDTQRMQGELIKRGAATIEQIALMLAIDQNFGGPLAQLKLVVDTVSELIQGFGDVPTSSRSGT